MIVLMINILKWFIVYFIDYVFYFFYIRSHITIIPNITVTVLLS